jgi:hypothetical protein
MLSKSKSLYEDGHNFKEIGGEVNKDPRTVAKIIRKEGYQQLKKIRRSKYSLNESYFDSIGGEQLWLIGLLAADGNVVKDRYLSLSQSGNHGKDIIKYIMNQLSYDGKLYCKKTTHKDAHSFQLTSRNLISKLIKYNITPNKSLIYELPKLKNYKDFLRGYFEGDGSVGAYDNGRGYKNLVMSFVGTKEFIYEVVKILPNPPSSVREIKRVENCWEIRYNGKKAIKFGEWLFSNENLYKSKKYRIFAEYKNNFKPISDKYDILRDKAKRMFNKGKPVMVISDKLQIPFQTIYEWKKKNWQL